MWVGEGGKDPRRARVRFFFRGEGGLFLGRKPDDETLAELSEQAQAIRDYLRDEGAALLPDLVDGTGLNRAGVQSALIELVLAGLVTNDALAALRAVLGYEPPAQVRRARMSTLEAQLAQLLPRDRPRPLTRYGLRDARRRARDVVQATIRAPETGWVGRWTLVHRPSLLGKPLPDEERALRQARQMLARWGVVTRAALEREGALAWDQIYPQLARLEVRGEVRRGYFVEGLPGLQFALPDAVERLRATASGLAGARPGELPVTVLSAVDPAQLFGTEEWGGPLRFARVPSAAVAAAGGEPVAVMEEGGSAVEAVADHPALVPALRALAAWWAPRTRAHVKVERLNGQPVRSTDALPLLESAGFVREVGGMLWSGR
jgi:ATP-dependent Lhr-like helicase